ncbi:hypothetical protein [Inhella proteolytica]|uniref:Uncharacterized protein n=1 Tax=Inhella proteolytica TaxID=2795029 RepID=A0A931J4X5_9BURK|nr:hypothetical protein [Inhella proteolytica]MBH9578275.1 hypothetical protein [Inhella proteolytica]
MAPADGWTPWERPGRWWLAFAIGAGSWVLAARAFSQSCLSFGGGGTCTPGVELPGWLLTTVMVWVQTGLPVLGGLFLAALLITVLQWRKRRRS